GVPISSFSGGIWRRGPWRSWASQNWPIRSVFCFQWNLHPADQDHKAQEQQTQDHGKEYLPEAIGPCARNGPVFPIDKKVVFLPLVSIGADIDREQDVLEGLLGEFQVHAVHPLDVPPDMLHAPSGGNVPGHFLGVQMAIL